MKKIFGTLLICLSLVVFVKPSMAGTCNGGVEFQGAVNGHTYCRSSTTMTWWAAIGWCKKQGRELASMDQLCDWDNSPDSNSCQNMKVDKDCWGWSSNPSGSVGAYGVHLSLGHFQGGFARNSNGCNNYAICY